LPHWLLLSQTRGVMQFVLSVHALKHAEPLQTYGLQGRELGAAHAPLALHVDGGV
jgi:hypothetical protein